MGTLSLVAPLCFSSWHWVSPSPFLWSSSHSRPTRNVVCPSGVWIKNRPHSMPSIRLVRNPKCIIVQLDRHWIMHTHYSRLSAPAKFMCRWRMGLHDDPDTLWTWPKSQNENFLKQITTLKFLVVVKFPALSPTETSEVKGCLNTTVKLPMVKFQDSRTSEFSFHTIVYCIYPELSSFQTTVLWMITLRVLIWLLRFLSPNVVQFLLF